MADDKGSAVSAEHLGSGSEGSNNLVIVVDTNSDQPESLDKAFPKNGPIPTIAPLPDHGTLGLGTDFRSMEDLATRNRRFFQLISSKKYRKVEDFLADRGHEVGIVPKVGCSALHYTKFNVANWESSDTRDSPLILASKIDCQMVDIILKFGGNPNHTNFDGDSPLSIAASRGDQETIDTLLLAGANLTAAIIKLTSSLRFKSQGFDHESETGFSIKSLNLLVNDEVFLKCREPIRTAFDVRRNIELILEFRDEFKIDFEYLIRDCEQFAYRLLNQCDKMWEARQVLDRAHGLLRKAIDERNKQFVSHPFSQQIIQEEWRGELTYKNTCCDQITIWMWYLASPIVLPFFLLKYIIFDKPRKGKETLLTSACGRHMKLLFTPYVCFVTDMVNYFILLGLLILVCILPQTSSTPGIEELILWACALSRLLIELDQVFQQGIYRYATFWNFVDVLTALLMTIAAIFRISLWINAPTGRLLSGEEKLNLRDYIMINTYLYAFAEFFLIIRWLNLLEVTTDLGPLLIAMKYMVADVLKFVFLLLATCVLGAFVSIYSITTNIQELEKTLIDNKSISNVTIPDVFNAPGATLVNLIWSTFGLLEMPGIEYHGDAPSTIVMQVIILIYVLIACVMMLNMLIAMLNNTYERIHENCDIEWKYARAELLKEYRNGQPFMFPFHVLLLPVTAMFRQSVRKEEKKQREVDCQAEEERKAERNTLFNNLCERYEKEKKTAELAIAIESGSGAGFRDRTPAEARTFSFMRR